MLNGRTIVTFGLILLCLLASSAVYLPTVWAQFKGDITINVDGSINPSTAPIQQTGNIYTLTGDLKGAITVNKSNITLNGNGHSISAAQIYGSNSTIENFLITGGGQFGEVHVGVVAGILLSQTNNVVVANNTISNVTDFVAVFAYYETVAGIVVSGGHSNTISGNNLVNNWQAMDFSDTSGNLIVGNNLTSNMNLQTGYAEPGGINFDNASNNTIYHNNFQIQTGGQAKDSYYGSVNVWDNGYPFGGNYWSDYKAQNPNAAEIDNSGIGNTSYVIDGLLANLANNTDRYPLMHPFNDTFYELQNMKPKISVTSPLNQTYSESSVCLTFSVEVLAPVKPVSWVGYSLDGEPKVTLASNIPMNNLTLANMTIGSHNITIYANDTYGNIADSKTIYFIVSEPRSFPTLVIAVLGTGIAVLTVSLLLYRRHRKTAFLNK